MFGFDASNLINSLKDKGEQEIIAEAKKHLDVINCKTHGKRPVFKGVAKDDQGNWKVSLDYCCDDQKNEVNGILSKFNLV